MKKIYAPYFFLGFLLCFAVIPLISQNIYEQIYTENINTVLQNPSLNHLLGTDAKGRDMLFRLFYGASLSLWMGLAINILGVLLGVVFGIFLSITVKNFGMQIIESLLAIPFFVLGGIFSVLFGTSMPSLIFSFGLLMALPYAYMTQSYILDVYQSHFIKRSRELGYSSYSIFFRHMLPIIRGRISHQSWISIHSTIFALASMTFLGFGLQAPIPEWGSLIYSGLPYIKTNPILLIAPFLLFIGLSWSIYTITNQKLFSSSSIVYPHFTLVNGSKNYLVAQLHSFESFTQSALKLKHSDKTVLSLKEDYYFNFPKSHTIKHFLQDVLGKNYTTQENNIIKMCDELELPYNSLTKYPHELSGGMLQRWSLILGALLKPEILLLESPFSSLNPELKEKAVQFILEYSKNTLLITSPYLDIQNSLQKERFNIKKMWNNEYIAYKAPKKHIIFKKNKPHNKPLLELQDIELNFNIPSLEKYSITIYEEEILGIVGYSGIGKTTLGKIIAGLLPIHQGKRIPYTSPLKTDMIGQDPSYFNGELSVKSTLREFSLKNRQSTEQMHELLQKLDLNTSLLTQKMKDLSKSEQYQILLLRALLYQPHIIIIDELLDHIPYEKYEKIIEILEDLRTNSKMSIVLISHQQDFIHYICDRVVVLTDNKTS